MDHNNVSQRIRDELARIESAHDVRVLYACESGSRAWGFPSRDSDYDVRFLYVHPRDWYLSVQNHRDVIERPITDELDMGGWELRKALRLLRKSNPPLLEWLKSPIVYAEDGEFLSGFRQLAAGYYSPVRCFAHYLHMASGQAKQYLKGEEVRLKKYLYVLRPLLACRWIERGLGQPPMEFAELVYHVVDDPLVLLAIAELLARKTAGEELDLGAKIEVLNHFINAELARMRLVLPAEEAPLEFHELDRFFQSQCV
ncbi:MAG TPA: nucleotidyltransferase domain-containing protein [Chthoniobacteraceae bacterium]|nr:nucleotidyltransferase domain-containing protein [Chthoniobacteraceae bacterium]